MPLQLDYRNHSWYAEGDKFIITNDKPHIYERSIILTPAAITQLLEIIDVNNYCYFYSVEEFIDSLPTFPQALSPVYDNCCPCSDVTAFINGAKFNFNTRCWRVSGEDDYQDLIIRSELSKEDTVKVAEALKEKLDEQEWYNPYKITYCTEMAESLKKTTNDYNHALRAAKHLAKMIEYMSYNADAMELLEEALEKTK